MCHALGRERDPNKELEKLTENLDKAYQQTIKNLPFNEDIRLEKQNGKQKIVLKNLDKQEEPESLIELSSIMEKRLPIVDLPDIIIGSIEICHKVITKELSKNKFPVLLV